MTLKQRRQIKLIQSALNKCPQHKGIVHRGTNLPTDVLDHCKEGEVVTERAFTSTSTKESVATSKKFDGSARFVIHSSTGRDISRLSMYPQEKEVLFFPKTQFYINKVTETGEEIKMGEETIRKRIIEMIQLKSGKGFV